MPKKILIIDDDEDILEILNIIFQGSGYEVILAKSSQSAEKIQVIHPDLVLLDVRLAGSDKSGPEICKELKSHEHTQKVPVILLSGEFNLDAIAKDCNADDFISKPFEVPHLLMQIKKHLS
jgi:DNA-binding response OmpR family regulator